MTEKILILLDQTLFFIQGIQITFIYYYGMRPRRWGRIRTWLMVSLLIYSGSVLLKEMLGMELWAYSAGMLVVNCTAIGICYRETGKIYLKWLSVQYFISFCGELMAVMMTGILYETNYVELYSASATTVSTKMFAGIFYMAEVSLFLIIHRPEKGKKRRYDPKLLGAVPVYQLLLYIGYFGAGPDLTPEKIWAGYCYALFGIMLDCMLLAAMDNAAVRRDKEAELAELEMLRKQELQYMIYDNSRREELSSIRHDLGNQLQMLEMLLETERDREKIKRLIKNIQNKLRGTFRE